jgi:hypothetical protein
MKMAIDAAKHRNPAERRPADGAGWAGLRFILLRL